MAQGNLLPSFDELARLAREDVEAFEALRKAMTEEVIASAAPKHHQRLRGLQFRIDMERRRSDDALAVCVKLTEMMSDSFDRLRGAVERLAQGPAAVDEGDEPQPLAEIVPFPRRTN